VCTLALPVAIFAFPGQRTLFIRIELLALVVAAMRALTVSLRAIGSTHPPDSPFDAKRPSRPAQRARPSQLVALERRLRLGSLHAGDLHTLVAPVVRRVAADRLALNHGLDLGSPADRVRAEQLLGEPAWSLARPDSPRPPDSFAPGMTIEQLSSVVSALEEL
jgi:hypothetical protein